jgi:hypothetical protein
MAVYMYRKGADGETEAKIFEDDERIPIGWHDSPAKVEALPKTPARKVKANGDRS